MGKPKAPPEVRGDIGEIKAAIRKAVATITEAKTEREFHNADIAAAFADLETKGIPREAVKMAMKYTEWDEDKRAGFDTAYAIVREACGVPFEDGLFDAQGKPNVGNLVPRAAKAKDAPVPVTHPALN